MLAAHDDNLLFGFRNVGVFFLVGDDEVLAGDFIESQTESLSLGDLGDSFFPEGPIQVLVELSESVGEAVRERNPIVGVFELVLEGEGEIVGGTSLSLDLSLGVLDILAASLPLVSSGLHFLLGANYRPHSLIEETGVVFFIVRRIGELK